MSIRIMNRVWDQSQAEGGALLALLALADNATDEGYAWPSVPSIAQRARLKERRTSDVLAQLKADGEIDYIIGRGRGRVNVYVILIGLSDEERAEKVQGLHDKAEQIMQSLQVKRWQKAQKSRVSSAENPQSSNKKPATQIADLPGPTREPALIRHEIRHEESHDSTSTNTTTRAHAKQAPAARAGDDGEPSASEEESTVAILKAAKLTAAHKFAAVPPAVARAAIAEAQRHRDYSSDAGPRLIGGLLKDYLAEAWSPPEPEGPEPPPPPPPPDARDIDQAEGLTAAERADWHARFAAADDKDLLLREFRRWWVERHAAPTRAEDPGTRLRQIWQVAQAALQLAVPRQEYDTWLRNTQLAGLDAASATVTAPTADHAATLQARYTDPVRRALRDVVGRPLQPVFTAP